MEMRIDIDSHLRNEHFIMVAPFRKIQRSEESISEKITQIEKELEEVTAWREHLIELLEKYRQLIKDKLHEYYN